MPSDSGLVSTAEPELRESVVDDSPTAGARDGSRPRRRRRPQIDWRSVTVEEAEAEAHRLDQMIEPGGSGYPASYFGPRDLVLTGDGIRMSFLAAGAAGESTTTITRRPKCARLWEMLLHSTFEIDASFTVGAMIELLDLPPDSAREVYHRTMCHEGDSFSAWVDAVREQPGVRDSEIEYVEVSPIATRGEGVFTFSFDATGIGYPLKDDDEGPGYRKGDRINYSLGYGGPSMLRNVPLRYNSELAFARSHEETMEFLRGPLRAWREGGEVGPKPELQPEFTCKRTILLSEFIGALFSELTDRNCELEPGAISGDREE